jgi:hypothetical protein
VEDETPSTERRIYDAADAMLLESGSLDAVSLKAVVTRVGGRRQNVARVLNQWRQDREMTAADLPNAVLRAARNAARDMWLIIKLTAAPAADARPEMPRPSRADQDPPRRFHDQAASRPVKQRRQTSGQPEANRHASPTAAPLQNRRPSTGRYSSLPPGRTPQQGGPTDFAEGHAKRRADKKAASAGIRKRPADAPRGPSKPRVRKPAPPRKYGRAPETVEQKTARLARMRAYVERERPVTPPTPVMEEDWKDAENPKVARAVAKELRAHGRPMSGQALVDTGRINLATKRAYRRLPPALAGSRIAPGRGGYWFNYEERPSGKQVRSGDEPDYQIVRIFGGLLWRKALVLMDTADEPPGHAEISAHLQPEISDLNPEWLDQQTKRAKKDSLIKVWKGGFGLTKPIHLYD